jgi:ubiquinone/menaquinone biosynthesis C-methylase UbiE
MPRTPEQTSALFDRWARTYEESVAAEGRGPLSGYRRSLEAAAKMVELAAGAAVLDIGIGTGAFAARLAARGARIWGQDFSLAMLERCRKAHPDFTLSSGSFFPLGFPDETFDAVVTSFTYHEVPLGDRPRALRETARVLKRGGTMCILDIIFASTESALDAKERLQESWDPDESYALVGELDADLRDAGLKALVWCQTGPYHWAVAGRKAEAPEGTAPVPVRR